MYSDFSKFNRVLHKRDQIDNIGILFEKNYEQNITSSEHLIGDSCHSLMLIQLS